MFCSNNIIWVLSPRDLNAEMKSLQSALYQTAIEWILFDSENTFNNNIIILYGVIILNPKFSNSYIFNEIRGVCRATTNFFFFSFAPHFLTVNIAKEMIFFFLMFILFESKSEQIDSEKLIINITKGHIMIIILCFQKYCMTLIRKFENLLKP